MKISQKIISGFLAVFLLVGMTGITALYYYQKKIIENNSHDTITITRQSNLVLLGTMGVMCIMALGMSLFISHSISSPITKLKNAMVKVGQGEFEAETGINSKDELGELATFFRKMTEDLKNSTTSIKRLNQEIVEHKQSEELLKETNAAFEKANLSLKESFAKLVQADKMTALGELTSGVAHELNQPLNVTKIICQGILRDIQKGRYSEVEAGKDLPEIVKQMDKMAEIIVHMRIFTRQSDGTVLESHDINVLVRDALKFIAQQYKDHKIELIQTLEPELPSVMIDHIQIEQVCLNLLSNARYAVENSKKPEMRIEIKTYRSADGKDVVLEVIDNGIGIPDNVKPKLFQPFFTTKDPGKGTGLGLSVCYQIIQEHKGKIEFDSRLGEGTTFRVRLPVNESVNRTTHC